MKKILPYLFTSLLLAKDPTHQAPQTPTQDLESKQAPTQAPLANSNANTELIQCNVVFEQRKDEIISQLRELEDKKQSLELLQKASDDLFSQRENKLKAKQENLDNQLKTLNAKEESMNKNLDEREAKIKKLIAKNEELLRQIQDESDNKIAQTYAKMKDSKAAAILSDLPNEQAAGILFLLKAQEVGKILAKMQPQKAAELTEVLKKGPPFEKKEAKPMSKPNEAESPSSVPGEVDEPSTPLI